MAKKRSSDATSGALTRSLTPPGVFLLRMLVFLTLVGFLTAILHEQLIMSFLNNPGLNGLILGVLFIGIVYAFRQVIRLYPEIRWINAFRIADPGLSHGRDPTLLAPMATMLRDRTGHLSLSTVSMRTIMDSIGSRLDEARDTGKYMVGLLVFLGLLGTFWGLLETISSVGKAIAALDPKASDGVALFDDLKSGLAAPLRGMGTAFSSSLLGLSGSLILGFLELQASHAHNRFYNELEEWLSGITELTPGSSGADARTNAELAGTLFDLQRAIEALTRRLDDRPPQLPGALTAPGGGDLRVLSDNLGQIVNQMRAEQKVVREWIDEQAGQQAEMHGALRQLASSLSRKGG